MISPAVSEVQSEAFRILPSVQDGALCIRFEGTGDMSAVASLRHCLAEARTSLQAKTHSTLVLDITALYLLNSSCIKALVHFLYLLQTEGTSAKVTFLVSPTLSWQPRALAPLVRMAPALVEVQHA